MRQLSLLILFITLLTQSLSAKSLSASTDRALQLKKMKEEQRIALVIGNNNYQNLSVLKNPINDARSIKEALQRRGFEVIYKENATRRDMKKLISTFSHKLSYGGVGLYYFAGHGINVEGQNYLVAVDSSMESKEDVEYESYALNRITRKMQSAHNRLNIVILDACRNDPFSRGGTGGLAPIGNAKGMFVAYATQAGNVANDGAKGHGVFTKRLIEHMREEGATIEKVFKKVRASVQLDTQGKQSPGVYNQITGDFFFTLPSNYNSQKPQATNLSKPALNSSFSFNDDAPTFFSLKINTTPSNANVQITNIKKKYYYAMELKKGNYNIKVSAKGYHSKSGNVNLQNDLDIPIVLTQKVEHDSPFISAQHDNDSFIQPAMIHIKAGSFEMGSNDGDADEKPVHTVKISKDFYIGKYEVTLGEYRKCVEDSTCREPTDDKYYEQECLDNNCPVMMVSWYDAKTYTQWLSKKTGENYRLPTEAEWEYAARAGTASKYDKSNDKTHKVGTKQPNQWGLYDIHGSVYEWCKDWYTDSYSNTPTDGTDNHSGSQLFKVLRGGSWYNSSNYIRSSNRDRNFASDCSFNSGFRLARTLP